MAGNKALRIGHLSTFYHTATILMSRTDTEDRLGTCVQWSLFGTGPAIIEAFQEGRIDLAYIGLPPAIIGMDRGVDIVCIAGGHVNGTVITGRSGLKAYERAEEMPELLSQLEGKTVGVPGKGSIHDVILLHCLDKHGQKDSVRVINYRWADSIVEDMSKGMIEAAFGTPALAVSAARHAKGKLLLPAEALWPDNPSYGICVRRGLLEEAPEIVAGFLALHEDACEFIRTRRAEAARMIAGLVGFVDEGFVRETLDMSPHYCSKLSPEYIASTMRFVPVMKDHGYIGRSLGEDEIFDTRPIDRVHPGTDHYRASRRGPEMIY